MMWDGFGMGGFGFLGMLVFWGLAILVIIMLVRWIADDPRRGSVPFSGRPSSREPMHDNAFGVARERLAKGEITPEEFESIKHALER